MTRGGVDGYYRGMATATAPLRRTPGQAALPSVVPPRDVLRAFCERWQLTELALFGSVLRDDFGAASDVDVLVSMASGTQRGLLEWVDMQGELSEAFGRQVHLVGRNGLKYSRHRDRSHEINETARVIYARGQ